MPTSVRMLSLLSVLLFGCSDSVESLCSEARQCFESNNSSQSEDLDAQEEQCVKSGNAQRDKADELGCGSEYDAFLSCYSSNFECPSEDDDNSFEALFGECRDEIEKYAECDPTGSAFQSEDDNPDEEDSN